MEEYQCFPPNYSVTLWSVCMKCYSWETSFNSVPFPIKEPEHHCGAGLVSGFAEAYSYQRRTDPECEQMSLTPAGAWQAGQVSTISPINVL